jgi:hypothetical protein
VLDRVERRRLLVEPAGKDAPELAVRTAHVQLDEGAGQLLNLPGRGGLAGAQPHDRVADPDRLARPQGEVPRLAVTLVEEADDSDPLRHRRRAGRELVHGLRYVDRLLVLDVGIALPVAVVGAAGRAGGEREHHRETRADHPAKHHVQSGVQA